MSRIPPVEVSITVKIGIDEAFRLFTEGISRWWPMKTHSVGREKTRSVTFEGWQRGEIFELTVTGERHVWGKVLVWEPPTRVVYTWHPGRTAETEQEVEMRFRQNESGTEVLLLHRNWETLGEEAQAIRGLYVNGWVTVLGEAYRNAADTIAAGI